MSEDRIPYNSSVATLAHVEYVPDAEARAARLAHIGDMAVTWARAQEAFEGEYGIDMKRRRDLMRAADAALDKLRVAALAFIAAVDAPVDAAG